MNDEQCGVIKGNGEPCGYDAKYVDGKCGHHSTVTADNRGRPSKFTDKRARLAIEAAREESKSKRGCERDAGVAKGTIDNWLEQGHTFKTEDGLIANFFTAFTRARGDGESKCIQKARSEDGDASFERFMLASSYDYKKTEKREVEQETTLKSEGFEIVYGSDE